MSSPDETVPPSHSPPPNGRSFVPAVRASLSAKLERLLQRPVIARIVGADSESPALPATEDRSDGAADVFDFLFGATRSSAPTQGAARRANPWREDPNDGTAAVQISIDYDDLWRGYEKEILDAVVGTIENSVTFLTDQQRLLLERSPREFLALMPRPEEAELVSFRKETVGGVERVVELVVAEPPRSGLLIRHIAIVPNLVPLERQLAAVSAIERAADDGPLAPLRVLLGLSDAAVLGGPEVQSHAAIDLSGDKLDEFQTECVRKALTTPHFSVIKGPPGSGKTTVITNIIRNALARGDRVLVVSPTHVAVDNVVEKLAPRPNARGRDDLEGRTTPVRFAARPRKLLEVASTYWIGPKKQRRGATIATRVERCLTESLPLARELFKHIDSRAPGRAPITEAVAGVHSVICGTPIGILSFDTVRNAEAGSFDLLVVDEVSKMTLPEFLAVAVKARRWVLVGDPEQLPPFNNIEENATTLDDVIPPLLDVACSVGALLERVKPGRRHDERILVVSPDPSRACAAIAAHVADVGLDGPPIGVFGEVDEPGIITCLPSQAEAAADFQSQTNRRDRAHNPYNQGTVQVLLQRGVTLDRPSFASGTRFVDARMRAQAQVYENAFAVYHAQPWARRARQKLRAVAFRNGLAKYLPSTAAVASVLDLQNGPDRATHARSQVIAGIAERFAVNTISMYEWLTQIPAAEFDTSPLSDLAPIVAVVAPLRERVAPFVGTLKRQYRMRASLSAVPRELFYFGEALVDGRGPDDSCRVRLIQISPESEQGEFNNAEAAAIMKLLGQLSQSSAAQKHRPKILVITPYKAQERRLEDTIESQRLRGELDHVDVEVCTLDRCQGREAEFVFISLVRGRATTFMDAPKRWNVALTRAMEGLFIFGDVDAFLREANVERQRGRVQDRDGRPLMSLLARILEAYDNQIHNRPIGGPTR